MSARGSAKIISISGIDGSGKSTQARAVVERFVAGGRRATLTIPDYAAIAAVRRFSAITYGDPLAYDDEVPGNLYIGALISDWMAWTADVYESAEPDDVLVTDRYLPDILAQAVRHGADLEQVSTVIRAFPKPALSILLEIAPDTAHARLMARAEKPATKLDRSEKLHRLHSGYQAARTVVEVVEINAARNQDDVTNSIMKALAAGIEL